jgi:hypothetical protein
MPQNKEKIETSDFAPLLGAYLSFSEFSDAHQSSTAHNHRMLMDEVFRERLKKIAKLLKSEESEEFELSKLHFANLIDEYINVKISADLSGMFSRLF